MSYGSVNIPLHLGQNPTTGDAMDRLVLTSEMATMNPPGFRTASEKKNRKRIKTRAEKLAEMVQ
jgi:hypothetical protein